MSVRLTDSRVERIRPSDRERSVYDSLVPGLHVRVSPRGLKSWGYLGRVEGARKIRVKLGRWPSMDVSGARQRAIELAEEIEAGIYGQEVRSINQPLDVSRLANMFIEGWCRPRNRCWREQQGILMRVACEEWGWAGRQVQTVTRREISERLRAMIRDDGSRAIRANRAHAVLHTMFRWASGQGYVEVNPMLGMPKPAPERVRDRVLTEGEIRALWNACNEWRRGPDLHPKAGAIMVALLTGQRMGEVIGLHRSEVASDGLWRLPAARVKNKRAHIVPLPGSALRLLESMSREDAHPFGGRPITSKEKARLDACMREQLGATFEPWRLHDLRRTVRSGLAAAGVNWEIQHRIQNHLGPLGQMDRIYQRHDHLEEMAAGLAAWEARLMKIVGERDPGYSLSSRLGANSANESTRTRTED